jgi:metal-dependent amidase/aminoacylase/carboxypeptidase family protein
MVAVLRNGPGPNVLRRTDMDALPIEEKTGSPFAGHVVVKSDSGTSTPLAHACGHDIHISSWIGTAELMAANRYRWHGTLILIGQPAKETGEGAAAMVKDGLLTRFPKPDFALAIQDSANQPVEQVDYTPAYALAAGILPDEVKLQLTLVQQAVSVGAHPRRCAYGNNPICWADSDRSCS